MEPDVSESESLQQCVVCGNWKLLTAFSPRKGGGYYRRCKACEALRKRVMRAVDPGVEREYKRQRYFADVEASRAANRARYRRNIAREREKDRERYARPENREKRRVRLRSYYSRHQEREQALGRERVRRWRKEHREQKADQGRRRRARLARTPGAHTEVEWQALKARYGHRCLRCRRAEPEVTLTRDHVLPLGTPGATDDITNIQPLCGPCNAWKGRRAIDFRASRG